MGVGRHERRDIVTEAFRDERGGDASREQHGGVVVAQVVPRRVDARLGCDVSEPRRERLAADWLTFEMERLAHL